MNNATNANKVVTDVIVVRDSVSLMARFKTSDSAMVLNLRRFSRTRS